MITQVRGAARLGGDDGRTRSGHNPRRLKARPSTGPLCGRTANHDLEARPLPNAMRRAAERMDLARETTIVNTLAPSSDIGHHWLLRR